MEGILEKLQNKCHNLRLAVGNELDWLKIYYSLDKVVEKNTIGDNRFLLWSGVISVNHLV